MTRHERILVIDDEEVVREVFQRLLKSEGYQADFCTSGEEGLRLAREKEYDAVILDVMMNGLGGLATLQELRKSDNDIAVLMITAYASMENAIECMKQGAFDYITKPFDIGLLMMRVNAALEKSNQTRVAAKAEVEALVEKKMEQLLQLMSETLQRDFGLRRMGVVDVVDDYAVKEGGE